MNIENEESLTEQYAIISYARYDSGIIEKELAKFESSSVCYWFDAGSKKGSGMVLGSAYDEQFYEKLDNQNCKGIVFFITDAFLLSDPCYFEMEHFVKNYSLRNKDKFYLMVLDKKIASLITGTREQMQENLFNRVSSESKKIKKPIDNLKRNISLLLDLLEDGKHLYSIIGQDYCKKNIEKGGLFYNGGVIFGHRGVKQINFGYFPQNERRKRFEPEEIEKTTKNRFFDNKPAYFAPAEWIVIKENETAKTLLSKKLLFSVDYLQLKFSLCAVDKTYKQEKVSEKITQIFKKYFHHSHYKPCERCEENKCKKSVCLKEKIKIRLLSKRELEILVKRCKDDSEKIRELFYPETTYFAQNTNSKSVSFWIAGDIENAKRVDINLGGLSQQDIGVEGYYIRPVIDVLL